MQRLLLHEKNGTSRPQSVMSNAIVCR
jgi:hypothetical protein